MIATTLFEFLNEKLDDNFWKWFGESIMLDNNGKPIIFYHGTNKKFNKFKEDKPIWFTLNKNYAEIFSSNSGKIFKVFLKIEKPLYVGDIDNIVNKDNINYLSDLSGIAVDNLYKILKDSNGINLFSITNSLEFKELVKKKGYDSLIAKEGGGLTTYAVFNENQIRLKDIIDMKKNIN